MSEMREEFVPGQLVSDGRTMHGVRVLDRATEGCDKGPEG